MTDAWLDLDLVVPLGSGSLRARIVTDARVVGIVGPSGGGKTSLLRAIAGVNPRATGTVRVVGATWQEGRTFVPPWERRVGWVPQDALLFPHLDVRANLTYGGGADEVHAMSVLLGLDGLLDRKPRNLSGGERQRVALGRALLCNPRVLLLDEPFAALDDPLRARLGAAVAGMCHERGLLVVLVSHDVRDLAALDAERWEVREGEVLRQEGS